MPTYRGANSGPIDNEGMTVCYRVENMATRYMTKPDFQPAKPDRVIALSSDDEHQSYRDLASRLMNSPIAASEILGQLGLFLTRASLARILFMHDLYLKIINVPGCIIELGCHWGQNLALFSSFRTIYEPQNVGRKIIGFDTFEGYTSAPSSFDGTAMQDYANRGAGKMADNYATILDHILECHNRLGPRPHLKKHEIIKGDATETLPSYLARYPTTLIALAYFDIGVYGPTHKCLEAIRNHLTKGSIIGLDHLGMDDLPGDSKAIQEVLGYRNCRFVRDPRVPYQSYLIVD